MGAPFLQADCSKKASLSRHMRRFCFCQALIILDFRLPICHPERSEGSGDSSASPQNDNLKSKAIAAEGRFELKSRPKIRAIEIKNLLGRCFYGQFCIEAHLRSCHGGLAATAKRGAHAAISDGTSEENQDRKSGV